jgi:hypothetical protein
MEFFLGIIGEGFGPCLALLDGALSANTNLRPGLTLHLFERVTTRANQKTEEIDLRELLDRDIDLFLRTLRAFLLVVLDGRAKVGVVLHGLVDELDALVLQLLAVANLTGVRTTTMPIVGGRRRRRTVCVDEFTCHASIKPRKDLPLTVRRHKVVHAELTVDLLETEVDGIVVELGLWDTCS